MNIAVSVAENTIRQTWRYGRHHVRREQFFYLGDEGDLKMDVEVTIDGWEKFVFYDQPKQQQEVLKLLPYLDTWDRNHP